MEVLASVTCYLTRLQQFSTRLLDTFVNICLMSGIESKKVLMNVFESTIGVEDQDGIGELYLKFREQTAPQAVRRWLCSRPFKQYATSSFKHS